jgi:hypothetical protein
LRGGIAQVNGPRAQRRQGLSNALVHAFSMAGFRCDVDCGVP